MENGQNKQVLTLIFLCFLLGCASNDLETESFQSRKARLFNETGLTNYYEGDFKAALMNFQKALSAAEASDNREEVVRAQINLGQMLIDLDKLEEASLRFKKAFRIAEDLDDPELLFSAHLSNGRLCYALDKFEEGKTAYQKALEIAQDLDVKEMQAQVLNDLGVIHQALNDLEGAYQSFKDALYLYETVQTRTAIEGRASASGNLASIYYEQGNYAAAWDLYTTSLSWRQQIGDKMALVDCHTRMAQLLEKWGKTSDALLRYESAYGVAKEIPHNKLMESSLLNIIRLCRNLKEDVLYKNYHAAMEELRRNIYGNAPKSDQ